MIHESKGFNMDLAGTWKLFMDKAPCALEMPPAEYPAEMVLPGTTAQQGIGEYNAERETGFLSEKYPFEGQIWLEKELELTPEQCGKPVCFLKLERTRMTRVWVDGVLIGGENSLCTPHVYDLSGRIRQGSRLQICVKNVDYPTRGGHMTSPDTQTNWIGITGAVALEFHEEEYLTDLRVYPNAAERQVKVQGILHGAKLISVEAAQANMESMQASANVIHIGKELMQEKTEDSLENLQITQIRAKVSLSWRTLGEGGDGETSQGLDLERPLNGFNCFEAILPLLPDAAGRFETVLPLPEDAPLWSEFSPECITLRMELPNGEYSQTQFGLRDFKACGDHFEVNGSPTMLRGKHDGMVFPLTGAAPTDEAAWRKVFLLMKDWGINHYRFHTCCPPEAAFAAADSVGIYMEPELPFWGTIDAPGGEQYHEEEQAYLIREGQRILRAFSNHPSFCMLSLGNELWGDATHISGIIDTLRRENPNVLFTQGSNNFQFAPVQLPNEDFWTGVRTGIGRLIRGSYADCDKPLGRIQTDAPSTDWDYEEYLTGQKPVKLEAPALQEEKAKMKTTEEPAPQEIRAQQGNQAGEFAQKDEQGEEKQLAQPLSADAASAEIEIQFGTGVKKVKAAAKEEFFVPTIPIVTHEIGQYNMYPDYGEIEGYTGPLEARNLEVFRERLEKAGMGTQARKFHECSGAFARDLYKMEIEACMRSPHLAGFQVLDLQDFPGQGTALVGMLNARLENKGFITGEKWRSFGGNLVPLARFSFYVWTLGEEVTVELAIRCSRPSLKAQTAEITFRCGSQRETKTVEIPENARGYVELGTFTVTPVEEGRAELLFEIPGENIQNEWKLTVFAKPGQACTPQSEACHTEPERACQTRYAENHVHTVSNQAPHAFTICHSMEQALPILRGGGRVLLLTGKLKEEQSIKGFYCTDFWNYHMFNSISVSMGRQVPVGTMGLCMDAGHPICRAMYGEDYSTPQWYEAVSHCDCAILDDMPRGYEPIVQMIDNVDRNHRLGILYEAKVEGGSLLVCTVRFEEKPEDVAMGRLYQAILDYVGSDDFEPKTTADKEALAI